MVYLDSIGCPKEQVKGRNLHRTAIGILALFLAASAGYAQPPATSLAELRPRISPGETLFVTSDAGEAIKGRVLDMSDTRLVLSHGGGELTFTSNHLRRIVRRGHATRVGAVAGLVAGFAIGTLLAVHQPCDFTCFSSAGGVLVFGAVGAGIGLAGGAVAGTAFRTEQILFERQTKNGPSHQEGEPVRQP